MECQLDDEEAALKEYRERMYALLPTDVALNNLEAPMQNELDAQFDALLEQEYNEDQIGELDEEEVDAKDNIEQEELMEAVDEFIDDKKGWFRTLHR